MIRRERPFEPTSDQLRGARRVGARGLRRVAGVLGVALLVPSCGFIGGDGAPSAESGGQDVVGAAGWTRLATTQSYLVVANVLPGERMFTIAERDELHPTEGELIIDGLGSALGPDVRHIEAHIYDRTTGLPLTTVRPSLVVLNRTTGVRREVTATLMQDVNIGAPDIHFGNNVMVPGNSDLSLTVTIGDEEVTLDGHLD